MPGFKGKIRLQLLFLLVFPFRTKRFSSEHSTLKNWLPSENVTRSKFESSYLGRFRVVYFKYNRK